MQIIKNIRAFYAKHRAKVAIASFIVGIGLCLTGVGIIPGIATLSFGVLSGIGVTLFGLSEALIQFAQRFKTEDQNDLNTYGVLSMLSGFMKGAAAILTILLWPVSLSFSIISFSWGVFNMAKGVENLRDPNEIAAQDREQKIEVAEEFYLTGEEKDAQKLQTEFLLAAEQGIRELKVSGKTQEEVDALTQSNKEKWIILQLIDSERKIRLLKVLNSRAGCAAYLAREMMICFKNAKKGSLLHKSVEDQEELTKFLKSQENVADKNEFSCSITSDVPFMPVKIGKNNTVFNFQEAVRAVVTFERHPITNEPTTIDDIKRMEPSEITGTVDTTLTLAAYLRSFIDKVKVLLNNLSKKLAAQKTEENKTNELVVDTQESIAEKIKTKKEERTSVSQNPNSLFNNLSNDLLPSFSLTPASPVLGMWP